MDRLTLTQASRILGVPQHRLIHLCEQDVVIPDVRGARGRGSSREFSERNLFEFAVALAMRESELPMSIVRAVVRGLRAFEEEARGELPEFRLPDSLRASRAPRLSVLVLDGRHMYFALRHASKPPRILGGIEIPRESRRSATPRRRTTTKLRPHSDRELSKATTRTEIDLSAIARALPYPPREIGPA